MKKLIFLLLGIVILSSCNISYDESQVDNPKKSTTIEIQENVLDSCATIAEMNGSIYILDENQLVTHELKGIDSNHIVINNWYMILSMLTIFLLIAVLIIDN